MNLNRLLLPLIAAVFSGAALCAPLNEFSTAREQFQAALEAMEKREFLPEPSPELTQYPLYSYLTALSLRQSMELPDTYNDAAISDFLRISGDQPLTRQLRREWLANLAQREEWPRFLAEYPQDTSDVALQCSRFTGLLKTGSGSELREDVLRVWLSGDSRPQTCGYPFDWLKQEGQLTEERRQRRARLALDAGNLPLAELLIQGLSEAQTRTLKRELSLQRDPEGELSALLLKPDPAISVDALLAAWTKLIRKQPEKAENMQQALLDAQQVNLARAGEFTRQLALGFSWNRDPRGLQYFIETPEGVHNEVSYEWRVRAALWNNEWELARDWIDRMPAELAQQPRWRYWRARALEQTGLLTDAQAGYFGLLDANNYYAVLASAQLREPLLPRTQPAPPLDNESQKKLLANPAIIRSRELFLIGRTEWARNEWQFALDGADKYTIMQASRLAASWGWHIQAIGTATRAAFFDDFQLLYPRPYARQIETAAKLASIPPQWIYSVMRQESLYDPRAVSKRDAYGLLQLLLPTASSVSKRWQLPEPTREDLFVPEINVRLGAALLRDMTDKFGGRFTLALGAYNAGPNAVARWLPAKPVENDIWIENIPFNETRNYIQKIVWNIAVFGWQGTGLGQDMSGLLKPVSATPPP